MRLDTPVIGKLRNAENTPVTGFANVSGNALFTKRATQSRTQTSNRNTPNSHFCYRFTYGQPHRKCRSGKVCQLVNIPRRRFEAHQHLSVARQLGGFHALNAMCLQRKSRPEGGRSQKYEGLTTGGCHEGRCMSRMSGTPPQGLRFCFVVRLVWLQGLVTYTRFDAHNPRRPAGYRSSAGAWQGRLLYGFAI